MPDGTFKTDLAFEMYVLAFKVQPRATKTKHQQEVWWQLENNVGLVIFLYNSCIFQIFTAQHLLVAAL